MGFFQTFWTWLNGQVTGYVANTTAAIATALEPAVVSLAVVYVMFWGYLQLTGRIDEPLTTGLTRIVRLAVVMGVGLHLWLYNDVIVDTFYRAPAQLAGSVIGASDPVTAIDAIWNQGGSVADAFFHRGSGTDRIGFFACGCIVWLLVGLLCVYVMFLIALADIASAVLLAVGPLFIALWLFDGSRRLFEAWLAQLVNYALVTILTVLIAALLLHVVQSYATQTAALGSTIKTVDALNMLLMAGLVLLLLRQILPIAAGLAGGVALSSFNSVSRTLSWAATSPKAAFRSGKAAFELGLAIARRNGRQNNNGPGAGQRGSRISHPQTAIQGRDL